MKIYNKVAIFAIAAVIGGLMIGLFASAVQAQGGGGGGRDNCTSSSEEGEYCLLSPLPELSESVRSDDSSLEEYLQQIYQYGVGIAIVLAIIMLIVGGVEYMTSSSMDGKASGRGRITAALIGLILALSSFALLQLVGGDEAVDLSFDPSPTGLPEPPPSDPGDPGDEDPFGNCVADNISDGIENLSSEQVQWACEEHGAPIASFDPNDMDMSSAACQQIEGELSEDKIKIEATNFFRGFCRVGLGGEYKRSVSNSTRLCVDPDNQCPEGTTEACFQEIQQNVSLSEREIMCNTNSTSKNYRNATSDYEQADFKLDIENAPYDELGSCYQLTSGEVKEFAENECEGRIETFNEPNQLDGTYCIIPSDDKSCQEATEGEFVDLSGLDDEHWDENLCDTRGLLEPPFSGDATRPELSALDDMFEQFTDSMGVDNRQTSGYYNDEGYLENQGKYHAGIDIGTKNMEPGDSISSPVSGEVMIMRDIDDENSCYAPGNGKTSNDKVAVKDDVTGKVWVFTHIEVDENLGGRIEAGEPIGGPSTNPGYWNSKTKQCDTFDEHLHLETHEDEGCIFGKNDDANWASPPDGCANSGFLEENPDNLERIQDQTMCPLQAYWENLNGVSS